jgi:hypothetical protein
MKKTCKQIKETKTKNENHKYFRNYRFQSYHFHIFKKELFRLKSTFRQQKRKTKCAAAAQCELQTRLWTTSKNASPPFSDQMQKGKQNKLSMTFFQLFQS